MDMRGGDLSAWSLLFEVCTLVSSSNFLPLKPQRESLIASSSLMSSQLSKRSIHFSSSWLACGMRVWYTLNLGSGGGVHGGAPDFVDAHSNLPPSSWEGGVPTYILLGFIVILNWIISIVWYCFVLHVQLRFIRSRYRSAWHLSDSYSGFLYLPRPLESSPWLHL